MLVSIRSEAQTREPSLHERVSKLCQPAFIGRAISAKHIHIHTVFSPLMCFSAQAGSWQVGALKFRTWEGPQALQALQALKALKDCGLQPADRTSLP